MNYNKIIPIASDHAGFELKNYIINYFNENHIKYDDLGCYSELSIDYPDYAHKLSNYILEKKDDILGILICGSGNGISMAANKHNEIRCALCWNNEISKLARKHNNANIISLPARFITFNDAIEMIEIFFKTSFEGGRHKKRIEKIPLN